MSFNAPQTDMNMLKAYVTAENKNNTELLALARSFQSIYVSTVFLYYHNLR